MKASCITFFCIKFGGLKLNFDVHVTVHRKIRQGKEPTRCITYGVYSVFFSSTCFGHQYAHHQEYNMMTTAFDVQHWYCFLGSSRAELLAVCTVWQLLLSELLAVYTVWQLLLAATICVHCVAVVVI
jgi:hypothetical protein